LNHIEKIMKSGILIDLNIRFWTGQVKLNHDDLGFTQKDISTELITLGRKNLIPSDDRKSFRRIESRARALVDQHSFPFPIGNAKFVPDSVVPVLIEGLTELQKEYTDTVNSFIRGYPKMRKVMMFQFKKSMPAIYKRTGAKRTRTPKEFTELFTKKIETLYPDPQIVKLKFSLQWRFFEVNLPNFKKRSNQFFAKRTELNEKMSREYQATARREIETFLGDVVGTLRDETVKTCSFVTDKIKKGEVVTEKNLNTLRKFVDKFEMLNFMGDSDIGEQLATLRKTCLKGVITYKDNKKATGKLKRTLNNVMKSCADISDVSTVTGNWKRKIKMD